eukprot:3600762-Rhodomonas_salina.1
MDVTIEMAGDTVNIERANMILLGATSDGKVIVPTFIVKDIGQTNPVASFSNTIAITLTSNLLQPQGATVVISGLSGAIIAGSFVELSGERVDIFCDGDEISGRAEWNSATSSLKLHLCEAGEGMLALAEYVVFADVLNPPYFQNSPNISISAEGSAAIAVTLMNKPGTPLFGIENGADPMTVVVPSFTNKEISQSIPVSSVENILTLRIQPNVDLSPGSLLEVTGLQGAQVDDSVFAVSRPFCAMTWNEALTALVFEVCSDDVLHASRLQIVKVPIFNPPEEQSSPPVSISAQSSLFVFEQTPMIKPGSTLYGVEKGADPLEI